VDNYINLVGVDTIRNLADERYLKIGDSSGVPEAPNDSAFYARGQETWKGIDASLKPTGQNWISRQSPGNMWRSITYGNGLFVAVAQNGTGNRVMTLPDGINWTARTSAADNQWMSVAYGSGLFVAVATSGTGNRVMTSPDGIKWTARQSAADSNWYGVVYGNGLFVAAGRFGAIMTSPDGITWTLQTTSSTLYTLNAITYGNGLFVVAANYGVLTSPDGIVWTEQLQGTTSNQWYGVTYGNGLFVAVSSFGSGDLIITSPEGIIWTVRQSPADYLWNSVTYGNGLFVAVAGGTVGGVMTSPDGITWTAQQNVPNEYWLSVTYGNNMFVAVAGSGIASRVMTSHDILAANVPLVTTSTPGIVQVGSGLSVDSGGVLSSSGNVVDALPGIPIANYSYWLAMADGAMQPGLVAYQNSVWVQLMTAP